MSNRNVLVLGALAVALFAFIVLFERESLSTGEVAGREGRILPRFARDRVTEMSLEEPATGRTITLRREPAAEEGGSPRWRLVTPLEAPADEEAVASLLGMLEYADARRRIEGISADDRVAFGFAAPRLVLRLQVGPEATVLALGGDDPTGSGVYAQIDDAPVALVVGQDVLEALSHDAEHFRSRSLFPDGLGALRAMTLTHDGVRRRLEREGGRWWLREPVSMWASDARMRDAQRALGELSATRFLTDGTLGELAPYLEIEAEPQPEEGAATASFTLRVGAPCPEGDGERVARLDEGPWVCVAEADLVPLLATVDELREMRAITAQDIDAESIVVEARGARLELEDGPEGWKATRVIGGDSSESAVDPDALSEWLRALRGLRAESTRPADAAGLRAAGLSAPVVTLRIDAVDDGHDETLQLGPARGGHVWARRDEEPVLLDLPASALAVADVGPAHFRARRILDVAAEQVASVEIDRNGRSERVERAEVGFHLVRPVEAPADRNVTRDLVSRLAQLETGSWVGEAPDPRQGLAQPRVRVRFTLDPEEEGGAPREHELKIGAPTDGGAYAQLDADPAVFVLPTPVLELVESSLASRELLTTDVLHLEGVRIEAGATRVELVHDGADFRTTAGPADPQRTRELTARLASLRATRVLDVDPAGARYGLASPRARVEIRRDAGSNPPAYTIVVGASDGEGGVYVRREDLPLVFVVPEGAVDAVLAYRP